MMTYEELLKAWRAEREAKKLAKLPDGFYREAAELVAHLRASLKMADAKALKTRLVRAELDNVLRMLEDIFWARVEKALKALLANRHLEVEALTPEERELFGPLEASFSELRKFFKGLVRGEVREPSRMTNVERPVPGQRQGLMLIRLLADVPALVGADMKVHGPFRRGDVAFIPAENALGLIRKGLAVEVELA